MYIHFGKERWHQAAAFHLRYEVFVLEQKISLKAEFDALDSEKRHYFVMYNNSLPVATIRYQKKNSTTVQPDRFCVKKEFRQQGIGKKLLRTLEEKALQDGCTKSILLAEKHAQLFYEKLGYTSYEPELMVDGILCIPMNKKLS